jgi:hypothetical protein
VAFVPQGVMRRWAATTLGLLPLLVLVPIGDLAGQFARLAANAEAAG